MRQLRSAPTGPTGSSSRADVRRAVERLSEDEALRNDLTDDGYGPLLSAVASLAIARGGRFGSTDCLYAALRSLLAGAVRAAETGDASDLLAAASPPLVTAAERSALAAALPGAGRPADQAAAAIARALATAVGLGEAH